MSLIQIRDLTFCHEGNLEPLFDHVSFQIDTDWKLALISRNGRGKTTFLRLLCGDFPYEGSIDASVEFDYFPPSVPCPDASALRVARQAVAPFDAWEAEMEACLARGDEAGLARYGTLLEHMLQHDGYQIDELIARETGKLGLDPGALDRTYATLSHGERTKLLIAALFLRKNAFLLIDEPTNHLDMEGRAALQAYLAGKQGFLLVSHDRTLLDGVADHVLSINRMDMEVQRGNYSSWRQNREMQDQFERERNQTLREEIGRLTVAMRRTADWSDQIEESKIGTHVADRGAVGARSARMMKRAKAVERRIGNAIEEKQSLLLNVETVEALRLQPLPYPKKVLAECMDLQVDYGQGPLFAPLNRSIQQGQRLALLGPNGSGKSSLLRMMVGEEVPHTGRLRMGTGLTISYVRQDTAHLKGLPRAYAQAQGVDLTLFLTLLRKLDFEREAFDRPMEDYSAGQKKKVLLAASLATPAHLYLWDEPLNYVDVLSREQLETLLQAADATMVFVEHDRSFVQAVATDQVVLERPGSARGLQGPRDRAHRHDDGQG